MYFLKITMAKIKHDLNTLFNSKSIAIIGASSNPKKVGYALLKNLINSKANIFPINPKYDKILNKKCYKNVLSVSENIDTAIIAVPKIIVEKVLKECGEKKVKNVIIISSGYKEVGDIISENKLKSICEKYKMNLIGPNCLGVINTSNKMNASFFNGLPKKGKISFVSQSGALGVGILDYFIKKGFGLSKFISIGNMAGINFCDVIEYLIKDKETSVICLYIESLKEGKRFMKLAKKSDKPIIVLKGGKSSEGSKAVSSHTGSMAGSKEIYEFAFKQAQVISAKTLTELFDKALLIEKQGYNKKGRKTCIITNAGGPGILTTDYCEENKLVLPKLPEKIIRELNNFLPKAWSHHNPIDIVGDALAERYEKCFKTMAKCKLFENYIIILTPQTMTEPFKTAEKIIEFKKNLEKNTRVVACFIGGEKVEKAKEYLINNGIPCFDEPLRCVRSL